MSNRVVTFVKDHPGGSAIGAVVLVILFLFLSKGSGGGSAGSAEAAYYNAVQAQTQAGNAIQMEKMQLDAQTNQENIAATYALNAQINKSTLAWHAIDSNERISMDQQASNERIAANVVNLENSQLHSNEVVAQIQANGNVQAIKASKHQSFLQQIGGLLPGIGSIVGNLLPFGI